MNLWKKAFEEWSPSGCNFKKFHMFLHYFDFIIEYGAPALTYGGWWEKAHRFLVKVPYLRTGRRVASLIRLLMMRVVLADTVKRKKNIALNRAPKDSYVWSKKKVDGKWRRILVHKSSLIHTSPGVDEDGGNQAGVREHDGYLDTQHG